MLSGARREEIEKQLIEKGTLTVSELAKKFNVSDETIRRDFHYLEKQGVLKMTYGGAILESKVKRLYNHNILEGLFPEGKKRIAQKCTEFINNEDCIFFDSSDTAFQVCKKIVDKNITVITNSLKILLHFSEHKNINLISTGGIFENFSYSFMGRTAIQAMSNYHVDKAFISCRSISREKGLSDSEEQQANIKRLIIQNANQTFLIADYSKFDKVSFIHISGFENVNAIIMDTELSPDWHKFCTDNNINLYECGKITS